MTLEIRLLSFSTGQPHPLAEQPIIFIPLKYLPFDHCNDVIEIVGDFLALLITFRRARDEHEDKFFLVDWKKGEAHCVSDVTAHSSPIAYFARMPSFGPRSGEPTHSSVFFRKTPSSSRT